MSDKTDGSVNDPQQVKSKRNRSVLDKAINAVADAFKNGSAETTMAHWPDIGVEPVNGRTGSDSQDNGDEKGDRSETVTYTFQPSEKLEKDGKDKKKKKKNKKKDKKKQKKLEKKLAEKLKKKEKKARKQLKKEAKRRGHGQEMADNTEHGFNEPGPYGPGGL